MTPTWTTTLFSMALVTATPTDSETSNDVRPGNEIAGVLLDESLDDALDANLAALGPAVIPELLTALREDSFPIKVGEHGNSVRALDSSQEAAILRALALLPRETVLHGLEAGALSGARTDDDRVADLRVIGQLGGAQEVALMLRLAEPEADQLATRRVRQAFEQTARLLVARDPECGERFAVRFKNGSGSFAAGIVSAIGANGTRGDLRTLSRFLGKRPAADPVILIEIGHLGTRIPHPIDEEVLGNVRPYLRDRNVQAAIEAAIAAKKLGDTDAVPDLIRALDSSDTTLRRRAQEALETIADRRLGPSSKRWSEWHQTERNWWSREAPSELRVAVSGPPGEASRLILELSKKRLFRHGISARLVDALDRAELDLVVLTCAALGHLGSSISVDGLIEVLDHPEDEARAAAWRALQRLTGRDYPPDVVVWRSADGLR